MKLPTHSPTSTGSWRGAHVDHPASNDSVQLSGGGGVPNPKPGCYFVGTACYIGYQTCKYCCGNGQSYTQQCGWCIGWYDAPPCVGF
jgi:hypothetical protein